MVQETKEGDDDDAAADDDDDDEEVAPGSAAAAAAAAAAGAAVAGTENRVACFRCSVVRLPVRDPCVVSRFSGNKKSRKLVDSGRR